jgi:hypothetical protein
MHLWHSNNYVVIQFSIFYSHIYSQFFSYARIHNYKFKKNNLPINCFHKIIFFLVILHIIFFYKIYNHDIFDFSSLCMKFIYFKCRFIIHGEYLTIKAHKYNY